MQHCKGKKTFSEIHDYCNNDSNLVNTFNTLLQGFDLRYINSIFSTVKKQGVNASDVFWSLFLLRFINFDNVHQLMRSGISKELSHKKDVFYDFLNNPKINWRNLLWLFSKQSLKLISTKSIDEDNHPKCLIVDDSILPKTGKTIEFIGKVFDHGSQAYALGMKLLTLGYNDGKSFIPLDFSLHHEPGKKKNRGLKKKELDSQYRKERAADTPGYLRKREISETKIDCAIKMILRIVKKKIKVDYVLADSWFISENFIESIITACQGVNVIGLLKLNRILIIDGKQISANKVADVYRKNIRNCKSLKCQYIKKKASYKGIEVMGYWVKMKGQQNWKLLISTNTNLSFIKAMKIYQIRWSIEVFFKDCKQSLKLNSCQSKDLDAHIATLSLVFMNYTVLALKRRFEDYETLGILFKKCKDLILQQTLIERIWIIFQELFNSILSDFGLDWEKVILALVENYEQFTEQCNKTFETIFAFDSKH